MTEQHTKQLGRDSETFPRASYFRSEECFAWRNPHLSGRILELDGIRGLAILLVVIWHLCARELPVTARPWQMYALVPLRLTWSGVDLFFVLSGFLIGGILYDAKHANNYYRTFYLRRVHRIFPLYFAWLAIFLIGLSLLNPTNSTYLHWLFNRDLPVWSYFLFLQNFFAAFRYTFGTGWMGITWSLAVEEQFYLLLPLAIRKLNSNRIILLTVGAILLAPILRGILAVLGNPVYGTNTLLPCRTDALGVGVLLAVGCRNKKVWDWLASRRKHIYVIFLALGVGVGVLTLHPPKEASPMNSIVYSWLAAFYAALLLLVLVNPGKIERFVFRSPLLVRLGVYSYAVYIFHQGINGILHYAIRGQGPSIHNVSALCVTAGSLLTLLALAAISWRVLEQPLIHRAHSKYRYLTGTREQPLASCSSSP